eukprot:12402186-Karenia_brevis.AAC.1
MKVALTSINRKRNWALREAANQAKLHEGIASPIILWKERMVKYGEEIIFSQGQFDITGLFHGRFQNLKLP